MSELVGAASLPARLRAELGFELAEARPIDPGVIHNNRLLRLRAADGRELVAKLYYRDDRGRLEREFGALALLRRRGSTSVPIAHFKDDAEQYGVYSLEPGGTKTPAELTLDEVAAIGRLAAEPHGPRPDEPGAAAIRPAFGNGSPAEQIDFLRRRLASCLDAAARPDAYRPLRVVCAEIDLTAAIERLIAGATAGMTAAELAAAVPERLQRLNSGDFAPHNILVRPDGTLCAIDFEFCGWDDPIRLPVSFLAAEQSAGLTPAQAALFLASYRARCGLPDEAFARLDRARALAELGWVLTNLSLMTPAHVARKRFAGEFDLDGHLAERGAKLRHRLARAERLIGELA